MYFGIILIFIAFVLLLLLKKSYFCNLKKTTHTESRIKPTKIYTNTQKAGKVTFQEVRGGFDPFVWRRVWSIPVGGI